jgi:hypothetical protein
VRCPNEAGGLKVCQRNNPSRPACRIGVSLGSVGYFFVLAVVLGGCAAYGPADIRASQQRYVAAKSECVSRYSGSLTQQADCRTEAANSWVRPWYKYPDLMSYVQERRRGLAIEADHHEITHAEYYRQVAQAESYVAREENRRNKAANSPGPHESSPFAQAFGSITRLFP